MINPLIECVELIIVVLIVFSLFNIQSPIELQQQKNLDSEHKPRFT